MYYNPGKKFPSLSVTGRYCALNCPHCRGLYLQGMKPATTAKELVNLCTALDKKGAEGCLISGGCDAAGKVPLPLETLQYIIQKTNLVLNVHTGLVDEENAQILKKMDLYVSFEVPTPSVLTQLYRLPVTQEDYFTSLSMLDERKVVPHIMVGFNQREERATMERLKEMGCSSLVIIVFSPTKKTPLYNKKVDVKKVIETCRTARTLFPRLVLGCMRPRIRELEESVLLFDGIVAPTVWAKKKVEQANILSESRNTCCVIP